MTIFTLKGCYWNKIQHENYFFMVVYPVWSKPDNWALKQCHKFTEMAHSSSESLAEWCLQSDYIGMIEFENSCEFGFILFKKM